MGGGTDRNLLSIVPISELEFFFLIMMYYNYSGEIKV